MRTPRNRNEQKNSQAAAERRMLGLKDPRSTAGIFSRGKNVYGAASHAAHRGGGQQFGPPSTPDQARYQEAAKRRLRKGSR